MRYIFDNDMHIHTFLSSCSRVPEENPATILAYAQKNGLKTVVVTDHFWDSDVEGASGWYAPQNYEHIAQSLPLPQADGIRFLFGCETDMDKNCRIGLAPQNYDKFDFIIVPTTHLHMSGFTCRGDEDAAERAGLWVKRFDALLDSDLPFHKVGIAHPTCRLIMRDKPDVPHDNTADVLSLIPDGEMERLFARAAACGLGIELNFAASFITADNADIYLRPYRIAKKNGCKFYFGSDAHAPAALEAEKANAEAIIDLLGLEESDKFILA